MKALRVASPGRRKGSGCTLSPEQQKQIQKSMIEQTPDQLQFDFALWTRAAVGQLIKLICKIDMPIRTVGHYLAQWGVYPSEASKTSL